MGADGATCRRRWNAKPRHPMMEECRCHGGGAGVGEWDGFWPTSEPVDARQQVVVTRRVWERADEINMDVLETSLWRLEPLERSLDVYLHLVALALETRAGPSSHIRRGRRPHETACDELLGCTYAWV